MRVLRIAALVVIALCCAVGPAVAKMRVALLGIDGRNGDDVRTAVEEVLSREVTVLSEGLFKRQQGRLGVALNDDGYAQVAAAISADAVVGGSWKKVGKRWKLTLFVRAGSTGELVAEVTVVDLPPELDANAKDRIAEKLLPELAALEAIPPPLTPSEAEGEVEGPPETATETAAETETETGSETETATETGSETETATVTDDEYEEPPEGGLGPVGGRAFAYVRAPIDGGPFQQVSSSLWLDAKPRFTDHASASLAAAIDGIESSSTYPSRLRFSLREAYVSLRKRGWLLRAGQQIIPWGSSDVLNPTDVLTARDYRVFVTDAEQTRTGAVSFLVSRATRRVEATVVATPIFPASQILIPAEILPAGVTVAPAVPLAPELSRTEVAARLKLTGERWDVALIGFRGYNHTPELALAGLSETGIALQQVHRRVVVGGIDGTASLGKLVFHAEAAYIHTRNADGKDPTIQPSLVFAVVGVERPLGDRLRVQAQGVARYYPTWRALNDVNGPDNETVAALRAVAAANALLLDYQEQLRPAATLRIAYLSEGETFEAEVFAAMNFVGTDYLVRPLVGWRPVEAVLLQFGFDGYGGYVDRPLGALHPFRAAFAQATFAF